MYNVSQDYINLITSQKTNIEWNYIGTITTTDNTVYNFTVADLKQNQSTLTREICTSDYLEIGTTCSAELKLGIFLQESNGSYYLDGKVVDRYAFYDAVINLTFRLFIGNSHEDVPCGIYTVSDATRTTNVLTLTGYDNMIKFSPSLSSPEDKTCYDWLTTACTSCGVTLGNTRAEIEAMPNGTFITGGYEVSTKIQTWRDLIGHVASMLCGYAYIGRDGKLYIGQYGMTPVRTIGTGWRYTSNIADYETYYSSLTFTNDRRNEEMTVTYTPPTPPTPPTPGPAVELTVGQTYTMGKIYPYELDEEESYDQTWVCAEELSDGVYAMVSQLAWEEAAYWPGYSLSSDYSGEHSFGEAESYYQGDIAEYNVANCCYAGLRFYDTDNWKSICADNKGLHLVSVEKLNLHQEDEDLIGSGLYYEALTTAHGDYSDISWVGSVNEQYEAYIVSPYGASTRGQDWTENIVFAFNIDTTKIELSDNNVITIKEEQSNNSSNVPSNNNVSTDTNGLNYSLSDNPLLQYPNKYAIERRLQEIVDKLGIISYTPFEIKTPLDPALDIGDVIGMTGNQATSGKYAAITSIVLPLNGSMTLKGVGQNPREKEKSEYEKRLDELSDTAYAGEARYDHYINDEAISIGEGEQQRIIVLTYEAATSTHVDVHGEVKCNISVNPHVIGGIYGYLYNGAFYSDEEHTTAITPETEKIYVDIPTGDAYEWNNGAYTEVQNPPTTDSAVLTVTYYVDGSEVTEYHPVDTHYNNGVYLLNLMYFWIQRQQKKNGTFVAWLSITGGSLTIDAKASRGYICSQGWNPENSEEWDDPRELIYIEVTQLPVKTEYQPEDTLDLTGVEVTAYFSDDTTDIITNECTYSPADGDILSEDDNKVDVSYIRDGEIFTTNFAITVTSGVFDLRYVTYTTDDVNRIIRISGLNVANIIADSLETLTIPNNYNGYDIYID